ncbi:related to cop9 (constitutive photomorphogenic), subunit 6 [Cephalotrichum gorgonifer]|uniref:COP9 signalosome complex subunit 6 n=1 Tax=Cephalotrichum gorgonifer TaxID=2041049 RepID=A0AAE8N4I8_9PEZI|nr:related to cop9 (constitutive photomorphogenic), subunit 6 [Cephalotrichum gorgonifer]
MAAPSPNPLLSSHQPSDTQVILHPLVLLTISDYITRHTLRSQPGPIMGALLGQHNGREITIEHAFECNTISTPEEPLAYSLDHPRFLSRLEQFRIVHKDQKLDLVGWYTLIANNGPTPDLLPTHTAMLEQNDACLLLGFHPDEVAHHSVGAKLPLSIYESNYEADDDQDGEDQKMEDPDPALKLKFRELRYAVEAGDAEMISMDFVARGGGNAAAIERKDSFQAGPAEDKGSSKRRLAADPEDETAAAAAAPSPPPDVLLTREEEEMISSLTAKANAIKMLQSRIQVIHKYLDQLPASYKAGDGDAAPEAMTDADSPRAAPSNTILRQIQALVSRLDLIVPSDEKAFHEELLREKNDVHLVSLLNDVLQNTLGAEAINQKVRIIEGAKHRSKNMEFPPDAARFAHFMGEGRDMIL